MSDKKLKVVIADYGNISHAIAIIQLMQEYAADPMGGASPLSERTIENLVNELSKFPGAFTLLAYVGEKPIGLANCFTGFSTFACMPLINLHDLIVTTSKRGQGVGDSIIQEVFRQAKQRGACKVTLEVLAGNVSAQALYRKTGFIPYSLDEKAGTAHFWEKKL